MDLHFPLTRRESMKKILQLSGTLAAGGVLGWPVRASRTAWAQDKNKAFMVEAVGQTKGYSIKTLTRKAFEAAGGMGRFVSKGDVVAVKPNISWARAPHLGATTHPEVLEAVVELCQEAGAGRVRIADHTIHDARRCFAITGAGAVAKKTGADLVYPRSSLMKDMKLGGNRLDVWPVFTPLVEADKVINLPVAKHHMLSVLTLGMKNWIGAVGGSRWSLHQEINDSIVDLARFFRPVVTLIDAIRILVKNGPSGGSPGDVAAKHTLILSNDPVAADAKASQLFNRDPETLYFIHLAQKQGLGKADVAKLNQKRVIL
jgi:uncharacterized protein (DUF362 family)